MHWSVRQTQEFAKKYTCKPFHAKCPQGIPLHCHCHCLLRWVFFEKYAKMHERNIARAKMPVCRVIKISDHTKCWSGESPHCCAAFSRAPDFRPEFHDIITMQERGATSDRWRRRQVLHDVTSSVMCHSLTLFVTSRNFRSDFWCSRNCWTIKGHAKISWILS
jgi:hypothetical protein